jgi:hypothetical protein
MATVTRYATGASGTSWTSPTNANANDAATAQYTIAAKNTTGNENTLTNFGFDGDIPAGSVINSVQLEVEHRVSGTGGIAFLESAVAVSGTVGTFNSDGAEPTTDTAATYSAVARPGGGSWTRADLLDGTFTVRLRARSGNSATSVTYHWDYARVTVDYSPPPPLRPEYQRQNNVCDGMRGGVEMALLGACFGASVAFFGGGAALIPSQDPPVTPPSLQEAQYLGGTHHPLVPTISPVRWGSMAALHVAGAQSGDVE